MLSLALLLRALIYPRRLLADLCDHGRGPGFSTTVAGTCVLGSQCLIVAEHPLLARALWFVACGLWLLMMCGFFTAVVVREEKRLTPPYWINMGAVAITTLAGSTLLLARGGSPLLELLRPFSTGFTPFFWVTATWWIPLFIS